MSVVRHDRCGNFDCPTAGDGAPGARARIERDRRIAARAERQYRDMAADAPHLPADPNAEPVPRAPVDDAEWRDAGDCAGLELDGAPVRAADGVHAREMKDR